MILPTLRDLIDQHFNDAELRQLCFDLSIEYENLPGDTRIEKAQSLVAYCARHNLLQALDDRCRNLRPKVDWPNSRAIAVELVEINQAKDAIRQSVKDEVLLDLTLKPLQEREDLLLAQLTGSGALAYGTGSTALGKRAVQAEQAQVIITGNNNSVQAIIKDYPQSQNANDLKRQIGQYLTWLIDWAGTLELRGIQRQGQQVVQLPLEEVYVPLSAYKYSWSKYTSIRQETRHLSYDQLDGYAQERKSRINSEIISLDSILSQGKRLILVGGPGSGKTTVMRHIAWALALAIAKDDRKIAVEKVGLPGSKNPNKQELLPLPIFVPLSAYAAHLRELSRREDRTLANFISHYLFERQTNFDLPADFFPNYCVRVDKCCCSWMGWMRCRMKLNGSKYVRQLKTW